MVSNHTLPRWFLVKSLALALILSIARLALAAPVNQTEGARISIRAQDNYFERYASSCIPFKYRIGEPRPRSMPSVRTCGKHLGNPPSDRLIFYTGGTAPLARTFAEVNGLSTIYDADIDIDGWFVGTAGPAARAMQREAAGEQHWGQDEHYWFTGIMSEAIASKARGRVIVSVPAVYDTTAVSYFHCFELPTLQRIPGIEIWLVHLQHDSLGRLITYPLDGRSLEERYSMVKYWPRT